jgi:hypothetical protein
MSISYKYNAQQYSPLVSQSDYQSNTDLASRVSKLEETVRQLEARLVQRPLLSSSPSLVPVETGKRALLIGINYVGSKNQLGGCVVDVVNIAKALQEHGYTKITFLVDEKVDHSQLPGALIETNQPTKSNIIKYMKNHIKSTKPGEHLFLHYSGHGTRVPDYGGIESDGYNEAIVPVDVDRAGLIVDDELHDVIFDNLKPGAKIRSIFDCCHSGTIFDLPFTRAFGEDGANQGTAIILKPKKPDDDIIMFSGCMDSQTSADTATGGAMTSAILANFDEIANEDVGKSISTIRQWMRENRFRQIPQVSYNKNVVFDL